MELTFLQNGGGFVKSMSFKKFIFPSIFGGKSEV